MRLWIAAAILSTFLVLFVGVLVAAGDVGYHCPDLCFPVDTT